MRRALVSALLLVALAGATPARAADGGDGSPPSFPTPTPATAAIVPLQAEIMLLVELDALDLPLPPRVRATHDEWASFAEGLPRWALLDWLRAVDTDGEQALALLRTLEPKPSGPVVTVLARLSGADVQVLQEGGRISLPPQLYAKALDDLIERDGAAEPGATGPPPTTTAPPVPAATAASVPAPPVTTPPSAPPAPAPTAAVARATSPAPTLSPATAAPTTAAPATTPATSAAAPPTTPVTIETAPAADRTSDLPPLAIAGVGVALVVAVTALGWTLTRRGLAARTQLRPARVDDLLDAGRRLTSARDRSEVLREAVAEAVGLTRATGGVFVARDADGSVHLFAPHPLMPADLQRGPIPRALASGAASRSQRPGRSLLAVPVIHDGRVLGALAVVRPAPFGAGEQDLVGRLAPLVAGALHAAAAHEQGAELAYVDALTSVGNRRRFERDLDALARDEQSLVVAMVDVDHFKAFNDRHGHPCGDEALRLVADTLRSCVRRRDLVYRYGGEEFSILLPGATADEAAAVAERIRSSLAEAVPPCGDGAACRLTVSIGVATSTADPRTAVGRADEALFAAKRAGRDRVIVAEP